MQIATTTTPAKNINLLRSLQLLSFALLLVLMVLLAWQVGQIASERTLLFAGRSDSNIHYITDHCYSDCAFIHP